MKSGFVLTCVWTLFLYRPGCAVGLCVHMWLTHSCLGVSSGTVQVIGALYCKVCEWFNFCNCGSLGVYCVALFCQYEGATAK